MPKKRIRPFFDLVHQVESKIIFSTPPFHFPEQLLPDLSRAGNAQLTNLNCRHKRIDLSQKFYAPLPKKERNPRAAKEMFEHL